MEKRFDWLASRVTRIGPLLVTFACVVFAIVVAACGPGNGGGSGY